MFLELSAADTSIFVYSGFLGTIAARLGDSTTARRIHARFDSLRPTLSRPHAMAGYWQSKISGVLGDTVGAMRSLIETYGPQGRSGMHQNSTSSECGTLDCFGSLYVPRVDRSVKPVSRLSCRPHFHACGGNRPRRSSTLHRAGSFHADGITRQTTATEAALNDSKSPSDARLCPQ